MACRGLLERLLLRLFHVRGATRMVAEASPRKARERTLAGTWPGRRAFKQAETLMRKSARIAISAAQLLSAPKPPGPGASERRDAYLQQRGERTERHTWAVA
jgi:hypothetical protein